MAISPPSDIVLDVLNAADPSRLEMAQAKLKSNQATQIAEQLNGTRGGFDKTLSRASLDSRNAGLDRIDQHLAKKEVPESYRKFEAMVLQSFVKSMLPSDSEEVFGKGVAGDMWKGMMAEQLGDALSKGGGIGIAEQLARGGKTEIHDKTGHVTFRDDSRSHVASQLIEQSQLTALDKLLPGEHASKG